MNQSEFYYSVKSSGVDDGFVITQHERTSEQKVVNVVVMDDRSCIQNLLPNDELHNYLHRYSDCYCTTTHTNNVTIYTAYLDSNMREPENIVIAVTVHDDGSILKVESACDVYYEKDNDTFFKVDPRIFIIPRLFRYILFTRKVPRGKYFCNIFVEDCF